MNYYDLISLILTQLHEQINSDEFLERFRRPNSFVRYRKLTLKQVVAYLIHSKKRSMDIELSDLQRQLPDMDFPDVSRQAVSKARKGILPDLFKELFDEQVEMVYTHLDCPKTWFGYRIFAVDGSTLEIPLSNDTSAEFGAITSCNNHDVFWVEGLLSTIYDVFLYIGVRPHKEKINISKEIINKTRGAVAPYAAQIFTHLSVVSSRQRSYDRLRCKEVTLGRGKG